MVENQPIESSPAPAAPPANQPNQPTPPAESGSKIYRIIYFILALIEVLLGTRFLLLLLGANIEAGFAQFIKKLTDPLMAPFAGLFPPTQGEGSIFAPSVLTAMVVYAIVFYGLAQLIRVLTSKK